MSPGIMLLARNCPLETTGNLISCLSWNLKQWGLEGKSRTLPPCTPYIPIRDLSRDSVLLLPCPGRTVWSAQRAPEGEQVTLGKSLPFPGPQFPHLYRGWMRSSLSLNCQIVLQL